MTKRFTDNKHICITVTLREVQICSSGQMKANLTDLPAARYQFQIHEQMRRCCHFYFALFLSFTANLHPQIRHIMLSEMPLLKNAYERLRKRDSGREATIRTVLGINEFSQKLQLSMTLTSTVS